MKATYPKAMKLLLVSEGGNVDNKRDPGGRTSHGVTQKVFHAWLKKNGKPLRDVFTISTDEISAIYKQGYADPIRYDDLPAGVDYATFDGGVMSGPSQSAKWLQRAVGVAADGAVGNLTIAAAAKADAIKSIKSICSQRSGFVRGLSTFGVFGKGWISRIARVEADGVSMAMEARGIGAKSLPIALKTESEHAAASSKAAKNSAAASGAGAAGSAGTATQATDWSNLAGIESIILIGAAAAFVVLAIYLIHRSRVQKERAAAYAAVAAGAVA
jgi:lysozyme family protein